MDAVYNCRFLLTCALFFALTACDIGAKSDANPNANPDAGLTLEPPRSLQSIRAIDPDALFAEIVLSYQLNSSAESVTQTITAFRGGSSNNWNAALDIPVNTDFTLDIIWYDTLDVQRLNLTQLSRTFNSGSSATNLVFTFAFSDYDSSAFNDDGDSFSNLEERENGTAPNSFDLPIGASEDDLDNDGILSTADNCPNVANQDQLNSDGDIQGDECDDDDDNDGSVDTEDCAPLDPSINPNAAEQIDQIDNNCDAIIDNVVDGPDTDSDGIPDAAPDNCPNIANTDQLNSDNDAFGDLCDTDDDNDGSLDAQDCAPLDPAINPAAIEIVDQIDNNCDGVIDEEDTGLVDTDGDNVPDAAPDNCPAIANTDQLNSDNDSQGNACDLDDDNDGSVDTTDCAPLNPAVNPSAIEVLDGADTNCDGIIDNIESVTSLQSLESCSLPNPNASVVCGEVLAADAVTPIVGAEITLTDLASPDPNSNCLTNELGEYACQLPDTSANGTVNLSIDAAGFDTANQTITAIAGTVVISDAVVLQGTDEPEEAGGQNWIVQTGEYDTVQSLLAQLKGCASATNCVDKGMTITDSISQVELSPFDVAFINCGADAFDATFDDPFTEDAVGDFSRYRDFVDAGGHLYLTDLEATVIEAIYPGKMQFKTGINVGTFTGAVQGQSVHTGLQSVIGPSFEIRFDLTLWTPITSIDTSVTTFIEADITNVSEEVGVHPITIGFRPSPESGCVFFSSYHIEGESTGSAQELAMKYLVQNVNELCK